MFTFPQSWLHQSPEYPATTMWKQNQLPVCTHDSLSLSLVSVLKLKLIQTCSSLSQTPASYFFSSCRHHHHHDFLPFVSKIHVCFFFVPPTSIWGCLLGGVYVPCIYLMPGGVIVGDSDLCCCGPALNVRAQFSNFQEKKISSFKHTGQSCHRFEFSLHWLTLRGRWLKRPKEKKYIWPVSFQFQFHCKLSWFKNQVSSSLYYVKTLLSERNIIPVWSTFNMNMEMSITSMTMINTHLARFSIQLSNRSWRQQTRARPFAIPVANRVLYFGVFLHKFSVIETKETRLLQFLSLLMMLCLASRTCPSVGGFFFFAVHYCSSYEQCHVTLCFSRLTVRYGYLSGLFLETMDRLQCNFPDNIN